MTTSQPQSIEEANKEFFGEFYNENTADYLAKSAGSRWFRDLLLMVLDQVDSANVQSVADVGCGIGHKASIIKERLPNAQISGFDFSESAIEVAKKAYGNQGIHFSCDDITSADYRERYDLISAFDVLEHVDDWRGLVDKLVAVNNRYMLISVPVGRMRPYEVHIGHFRNFQRGEMESYMATSDIAK